MDEVLFQDICEESRALKRHPQKGREVVPSVALSQAFSGLAGDTGIPREAKRPTKKGEHRLNLTGPGVTQQVRTSACGSGSHRVQPLRGPASARVSRETCVGQT